MGKWEAAKGQGSIRLQISQGKALNAKGTVYISK